MIPIDLTALSVTALACPSPYQTEIVVEHEDTSFLNFALFDKPIPEMSSEDFKLSKFKGRLNDIASLEENWDGFNSARVSQEVINHSSDLLVSIPTHLISKVNEDCILPTPYGTILLELGNEDEELSIEVGIDELSFYYEINDELITEGLIQFNNHEFTSNNFKEIVQLLENVN